MSDQPKGHPIIFSGPMVRAIIGGRKSQTRRISTRWLKVKAGDRLWVKESWRIAGWPMDEPGFLIQYRADSKKLWREFPEEWLYDHEDWQMERQIECADDCEKAGLETDSDGEQYQFEGDAPARWRPSINVPRWASRITLEATEDARVEPLQVVSGADILDEGITLPSEWDWAAYTPAMRADYLRGAFAALWDSLHTKPGERFADNPDVVVLTFKPLHSGSVEALK